MAAGFQVFDESGVLSFDGTYQVPSQRDKASVTASEQPMDGVTVARFYTLSVTSDSAPIVGLRKPKLSTGVQGATILVVSLSGSVWTFKIVIVDTTETDFSFTYYVFGNPLPSPSGVGLDVYSESGVLVFTASAPAMRPVSSMVSGKSYAVFATSKMNYYESVSWDSTLMRDIYISDYFIQVHAISGTSLISTDVNIFHAQGFQPPDIGYEDFGTYQDPLLINVTNQ